MSESAVTVIVLGLMLPVFFAGLALVLHVLNRTGGSR